MLLVVVVAAVLLVVVVAAVLLVVVVAAVLLVVVMAAVLLVVVVAAALQVVVVAAVLVVVVFVAAVLLVVVAAQTRSGGVGAVEERCWRKEFAPLSGKCCCSQGGRVFLGLSLVSSSEMMWAVRSGCNDMDVHCDFKLAVTRKSRPCRGTLRVLIKQIAAKICCIARRD